MTKQASVTARRQHKGLAAQVVQFRPVRNHSAAYPTVRTDQFQRLPAGKNGHAQLFQSLGKDLPGAVKLDPVPVPVLMVEARDVLLLSALARLAEPDTHAADFFDGRVDALHKCSYQGIVRHAAAHVLDGGDQVGLIRFVCGSHQTQAPGPGVEAGAGKQPALAHQNHRGAGLRNGQRRRDSRDTRPQYQHITGRGQIQLHISTPQSSEPPAGVWS